MIVRMMKEKAGNSSQTEGVGEAKTMAFHLHGEDVEEEVVVDQHGPFQIGIGYPGSEDGTPDGRF